MNRPHARRVDRAGLAAWRALLHGLGLLVLLLAARAALAQAPGVPVVELRAADARVPLEGRYLMKEDAAHRDDAASLLARRGAAGGGWQAAPSSPLNLGYSASAWWLRLRLHNSDGARPLQRLLDVDNPRTDALSVYVARQGRITEHYDTGDRTPFSTRPVPHHAFVFPIALAPDETVDVLVRIDSHDGYLALIPLALVSEHELQRSTQQHTLLLGLYYGGLGLLLLYHLCVFASSRQASLGLYVAYLGALIVTRVCFEGHASQYWWPDHPTLVNEANLVAYSLSVVLFGAMLIVNLRDHLASQPRLRFACWAVIALNAVPLPFALTDHYSLTLKLAMPATFASTAFAMFVSVRAWRGGYVHTRFFLAGAVAILIGILAERLRLASVLPDHPLLAYGVAIGSVIEALCIALALADGTARLKADKLKAERLAREAERRLNDELGALVQERTEALAAANERLGQLAITDELTGTYNRRHFQHELAALLSQAQRGAGAIGLCLFDLDHFKGYNDRYGHPAGDEVLRQVTAIVRAQCRRSSDALFRVGGEEFALLMAGDDRAAMQAFVERIRGAVEGLQLTHESNPGGIVTASFGLVWCGPAGAGQVGPERLYAWADALLYRAKKNGRNRVECDTVNEATRHAPGGAVAASPNLSGLAA